MKAYLAAGWFTDEQEIARRKVREAILTSGMAIYSPKEDGLFIPGGMDAVDAYHENIHQIEESDIMVASTSGKDMGTLFECGFATAISIPVVYFWEGKGKFNLMLAKSAHAVFDDYSRLLVYLYNCNKFQEVIGYDSFVGEIE